MTISFYLTRPKGKEDTAIYARISYSGNQLKYYTPEKINPKFWSKETKLAKQIDKFKEYPEFNQRLKDWKTDVANIYRRWVNDNKGMIPNPQTLRKALDTELKKREPEKEEGETFFGFFQNIIDLTETGIRVKPVTGEQYSKATVNVYKNTLKRVKNFAAIEKRKVDFETINLDFYTAFTGYLIKTLKLASNTIGKDIKTIKVILNEATEANIQTNPQYKSRKFSVTSEQTAAIYLNESELKELEHLDLSENSRLERVRDLFLIGCYTGLRFGDWSKVTPASMQDGNLIIRQAKTGAVIAIPVHKAVENVLSKYGGQLPRSITNQKANEYLKEVGKKMVSLQMDTSKTITKGGAKVTTTTKKWEVLSTHTARRSFASNEYLAGTPAITIMAKTGHKTESSFLKYIKLTPTEHAKLMQLHWSNRAALRAV